MFGAGLALAVMPTLGWHWYLGLAATPLAMVLVLFPVCCSCCVHVCVGVWGAVLGVIVLHVGVPTPAITKVS